jgi:hypothetical protein
MKNNNNNNKNQSLLDKIDEEALDGLQSSIEGLHDK